MATTATHDWDQWSSAARLVVTRASRLDEAIAVARDLLDEVDRAASRFRPDSELMTLGRDDDGGVEVSDVLAALVREERIGAAAIAAQLGAGSAIEIVPAVESDSGLCGSVELHLTRYFAGFGRELPPDGLYERLLAEIEPPLLRIALAASKGNQIRAARLLGINRNTLRKKLTERGIDPSASRRNG